MKIGLLPLERMWTYLRRTVSDKRPQVIVYQSRECASKHTMKWLKYRNANKKLLPAHMSSFPVQVLSRRPLAPSVSSVTSVANDKGDNEMILGAPSICLTA